ncbi:NAD(P)-binding protein [Setomelanomma holmii]|uniref:NAD(P)-binding protein n=1 Tax=Setomelanomma holmii TaxID=210430 RepID=A0A9P4LLH0_9PLEO|nr:NAD(P)-binding protein [Setomelanomma holmii]
MLVSQAFGKTHLPIADLTGKTIIVTGANTGLGLECAKHLARTNASHIILACRNTKKGQAATESIVRDTRCTDRTKCEVWELDLSNYQSVLAFGERVRTQLPRLDAFMANAGMELQEYRTAEDLEIHLTVNVVSTFLSAIAILPKLRDTAKEHGVQTSLTFCGSMYHIFGPDNEFDAGLPEDVDMFDILSTPDPTKTDIIWRYALSKLMVHQCYHELVAALSNSKSNDWSQVIVNLVNPGWCGTELSRAKPHSVMEKVFFALMGWTAEKGSRVYIDAMVAGKKSHGKFLSGCQIREESQYMRSKRGRRIEKKMWKDLMQRIERISLELASVVR